jgi:hypothetical protein
MQDRDGDGRVARAAPDGARVSQRAASAAPRDRAAPATAGVEQVEPARGAEGAQQSAGHGRGENQTDKPDGRDIGGEDPHLGVTSVALLTKSLDNVLEIWFAAPMTPAAMLDPFWVGRRADAFDQLCR